MSDADPQAIASAYDRLGLRAGMAGTDDLKQAYRRVLRDLYRDGGTGIDDRARPFIEAHELVAGDVKRREREKALRPVRPRPDDGAPGVRVVEVPSRAVRGAGGRVIVTRGRGLG
jgi:hypothetical protein